MQRRGRLSPQATGIFGLILVVLVINGFVVHYNASALHATQARVIHTQKVLVQVELVISTVRDAESSARGYVITGQQIFREGYQRSSAAIAGQLLTLSELIADNPSQLARLAELRRRIAARLNHLESIVTARDEEGFEAGRVLVESGRGSTEMGQIREIVSQIQSEENHVLGIRAVTANGSRAKVIWANIAAVAMAAMVTAAAWYLIDRELEKRRQAEAAAHAERQHLLATLTSIGDAVIVTDAGGNVKLVNLVARELMGSSEELTGGPLGDVFRLVTRKNQEPAENLVTRVLASGKTVGPINDINLLRADGTEVPIEASAAPIRDESNRISGVVLVFRDFSNHLQWEEESQGREHRFRRMFETPLIGVAVGNSAGYLEEANDAYLELIGYQRGELDEAALSWGGVPVGQSPLSEEAHLELMQRGACKPFERTYLNSAGQEIPVLVSAARLSDDKDRIVVYVTDLTQSKRAEAALRESESRFRVLSECMPQQVWTARPDGQWEYLNQMLIEFAGRPKEELTGWGWLELVHPDDTQAHLANWKQSVTTGVMFEIELRLRKYTGEFRWHLVRALPLYAPNTQIVTWLGTNTDIHDQKLAEESLREEHRRKDQFLAVLAHELRNPLAPLSNAVQVFSVAHNDPQRSAELIEIMQRQLRQMTRLIDDLLDLARISQGRILLRRDRISVQAVVAVTVEAMQPMMNERQHQLSVRVPTEEIWLDADAARLSQILTNLLHNAAKYTHQRGEISLTVERAGNEAVFRVRDNGPGIAPEMINKVFDLFTQAEQTLDRSHGGLGIGLTLVRTLVELHGGRVAAQSDGVGRGSEFIVRLPLPVQLPASGSTSPSKANESHPLPGLKILVADDVQASAKTLALMLRALGQETSAVFDGRSALAQLTQEHFDVAFLDIAMPGLDGLEVAREIRLRRDLDSLTLVAVTGFGQEEDRQQTKEAGFNEHLVKPTSLDLLKEILQRAGSKASRGQSQSSVEAV